MTHPTSFSTDPFFQAKKNDSRPPRHVRYPPFSPRNSVYLAVTTGTAKLGRPNYFLPFDIFPGPAQNVSYNSISREVWCGYLAVGPLTGTPHEVLGLFPRWKPVACRRLTGTWRAFFMRFSGFSCPFLGIWRHHHPQRRRVALNALFKLDRITGFNGIRKRKIQKLHPVDPRVIRLRFPFFLIRASSVLIRAYPWLKLFSLCVLYPVDPVNPVQSFLAWLEQ